MTSSCAVEVLGLDLILPTGNPQQVDFDKLYLLEKHQKPFLGGYIVWDPLENRVATVTPLASDTFVVQGIQPVQPPFLMALLRSDHSNGSTRPGHLRQRSVATDL